MPFSTILALPPASRKLGAHLAFRMRICRLCWKLKDWPVVFGLLSCKTLQSVLYKLLEGA